MTRVLKALAVPLVALCSFHFGAAPATAFESDRISGDRFGSYGLRTLCEGNCEKNATIEAHGAGAPFDADFTVGLEVLINGLDLSIETDGNIFIYGPLSASGSINLRAIGSITIEGYYVLSGAGEITLTTAGLTYPPFEGGNFSIPPGPICGCITLDPGANLLAGEVAGGVISSALVGLDEFDPPPGPGVNIYYGGDGRDVYLDVSMVDFLRFEARAGKSMVLVGPGALPVPEPGTALMLGLGLFGLAARRTRPRA